MGEDTEERPHGHRSGDWSDGTISHRVPRIVTATRSKEGVTDRGTGPARSLT